MKELILQYRLARQGRADHPFPKVDKAPAIHPVYAVSQPVLDHLTDVYAKHHDGT